MKKLIKFSNGFPIAMVLSSLLIIMSIVGFVVKGFNLGVDFNAGLIQEIRIGDEAMALTYNGPAAVTVNSSADAIDVVVTGASVENATYVFPFADYPTAGDLAAALSGIDGITAKADVPAIASTALFVDAETLTRLGNEPYFFFYVDNTAADVPIDDVRAALADIPGVAVQNLGTETNGTFQIRVADDGTNPQASTALRTAVAKALEKSFGDNRIAVLKTDFVGAMLSKSLGTQFILLLAATFALIFIYVTFRFRWDMALAGILALVHDCIVMAGVIIWLRIEVNTTIIAAFLTIVGYSINDTIVIYDRIRENTKLLGDVPFIDILNRSLSDTLSRTILTTVTTLLAVLSLFIATTGTMKDFSLILIVGFICGTYTTMFITSMIVSKTSAAIKNKPKKSVVKPDVAL